MIELDSGYMRDQLMLEILLDIRDLFSVAPGSLRRQRAGEARGHPPAHQAPLKGPMARPRPIHHALAPEAIERVAVRATIGAS